MARFQAVAEGRWGLLDSNRQTHLNRARTCAKLTLPALLPPEGADENTSLPTPWQSMGARCVNNLASKIVLTLMPPNSPCMRFVVDQKMLDQLKAQGGDQAISSVEEILSSREWEVQKFMEKSRIRVPSYRIMRLLIVTGNALMYRHDTGTLKVYRLDQYVVRRNGIGEPVEIVIKEPIDPVDTPQSCREEKSGKEDEGTGSKKDMYDLYTYCIKRGEYWHMHQEINGKLVPQSKGKLDDGDFPFRPLVWSLADGENYGRGHVEEYIGDFISLEELRKSLVETTAAGAKLVFLVNPNGVTRKKDLINAENGGFVVGQEGDVVPLRVEKMNDLAVAAQEIGTLNEGLARAFLLHTSIQRQGERVTAEEIRFMAQDIEDALGGIYSILAQEYQMPLVEWALKAMEENGSLAKLPEGITVSITTGLEALGRGHDLAKLNSFLQNVSILGPEVLMKYLIITEYFKRVATALGIHTTGLIKTEEQIQQENHQMQQQAQQADVMDKMANSPVAREYAKADAAANM